ncbi:cation-transporting P-type ATPase [Streptomyces althioticus]|uniref:cation-transporting P-type ATPase n=1 Tax=Streptomyces althioticus TaxID=83380 RepID=UPI00368317F6
MGTSRRGLPAAQARAGLEKYGANELPRAGRRAVWRQLGARFTDLFAVVLIIASGITFLAYALQEPRDVDTFRLAVAILGVVLLNAAIGFAQEYSAERTAQALEAMVPHTCRVLRGGEFSQSIGAPRGRCPRLPGSREARSRSHVGREHVREPSMSAVHRGNRGPPASCGSSLHGARSHSASPCLLGPRFPSMTPPPVRRP